jgi:hypothetical protein
MKALILPIAVFLGVALAAPMTHAHSVGWSILPNETTVVLSFTYGSGDPMAFAEVTITASDGLVYQKGRADRSGKFAFAMPATAGEAEWIAAVVDGEGHNLTTSFQAGSEARVIARRDTLGRAMGLLALIPLMAVVVLSVQLWSLRKKG